MHDRGVRVPNLMCNESFLLRFLSHCVVHISSPFVCLFDMLCVFSAYSIIHNGFGRSTACQAILYDFIAFVVHDDICPMQFYVRFRAP